MVIALCRSEIRTPAAAGTFLRCGYAVGQAIQDLNK
jgi:hypothetical protein